MRGRTLNNTFIILDEAQEPSRLCTDENVPDPIGFGSKVIITGDASQRTFRDAFSGLDVAMKVLKKIDDISIPSSPQRRSPSPSGTADQLQDMMNMRKNKSR